MTTSFIIPAYNEEKYIEDCLKSIYNQEGLEDFEVIVVDNASTDNTAKVVREKFPQAKLLTETKKGPTWARRKGFENTGSEILVYFDADIRVPKWWYKKMIKIISSDEKIVAVTGPYIFYGFNIFWRICTNYIYNFIQAPLINFIFTKFFKTALFFGGNFAVKKWALEKIGGFDISYKFYADDTNIGRRLMRGGKVKFISTLYVYASTRRFKKEGTLKMFYRYTMNFVWEAIFHRPFTP